MPINIIAGKPNSGKTTSALTKADNKVVIFSCPTIAQAIDLGKKFNCDVISGDGHISGDNKYITIATHGCLKRVMKDYYHDIVIVDEAQLGLNDFGFTGNALHYVREHYLKTEVELVLISSTSAVKSLKKSVRFPRVILYPLMADNIPLVFLYSITI